MAVRKTAKGAALKRWFKEDRKMLRQASRVVVKKVKAVVHRTVGHLNEFLAKLQKLAGK